jgi:hypothetical protein
MYYDWNRLKNEFLKAERSICFEDVLIAIDAGRLLDDIEHPNMERYDRQRIFVVAIEEYVYLVPYVQDEEKIFLKTIIPSRMATRRYMKGEKK